MHDQPEQTPDAMPETAPAKGPETASVATDKAPRPFKERAAAQLQSSVDRLGKTLLRADAAANRWLEAHQDSRAVKALNKGSGALGRGLERFVTGLPQSKMVRLGLSFLNLLNPFAVQARYLAPGYAKRPLKARPVARRIAAVMSVLPAASYLLLMTNVAVILPIAVSVLFGSVMINVLHKEIAGKKLKEPMEETNEAGQRVSGTREDLCALALRQRLVSSISKRFNTHATPVPVVMAVDLLVLSAKFRRQRVSVLDAGNQGAGKDLYEFNGAADSRSQMKGVATMMTDGAPRAVKIGKPLQLKSKETQSP